MVLNPLQIFKFDKIICSKFYIYNCLLTVTKKKKDKSSQICLTFHSGGVREIRTLAPVTRSTSLAGKPLHHLGITPWLLNKYITHHAKITRINILNLLFYLRIN